VLLITIHSYRLSWFIKLIDYSTALTDIQKNLYKSILMKDLSAFDNGRKTSLMNSKLFIFSNTVELDAHFLFILFQVLMQLRKCCNHPYMFGKLWSQRPSFSETFILIIFRRH
jgi:SNF2 family DNA or RNA helicase